MKKLILGIVIGLIFGGGSVMAARIGFPDANIIYQFNPQGDWNGGRVAVFDDRDNKCYISYDPSGGHSSISCVKR